MTPLVSIEQISNYVGHSGNPEAEGQIKEAIDVLSASFNAFAGYDLVSSVHTAVVVRGTGQSLLRLPARNVTAVSLVEYRAQGQNDWSTLSATRYEPCAQTKAGVFGIGFDWDMSTQYRVTFTAGWPVAEMPGDIVEQMAYEVRRYIAQRRDVVNENMGGQSSGGTAYMDISVVTQRVLLRYSLVGI